MSDVDPSTFAELTDFLTGDRDVVLLTGAGISAESGVDTFRGDEGLWSEYDPQEVATPEAFRRQPDKVRSFYRMRRRALKDVQPSLSHRFLADCADRFGGIRVITQNVDNLHEQAGQSDVCHVHGRLMKDRCVDCGTRFDANPDDSTVECPSCGGTLRPDVVWFGESLNPARLETAKNWLNGASLVGVIGTSLNVAPVSGFPGYAHRSGARLFEVNPRPALDTDRFDNCWVFDRGADDFFAEWQSFLQNEM